MDKNKMDATEIASDETQLTGSNEKEANQISDSKEVPNRSFGITDIWKIRRAARTFTIHNRIPRL